MSRRLSRECRPIGRFVQHGYNVPTSAEPSDVAEVDALRFAARKG